MTDSASATARLTPIETGERIQALDTLRGFALFGVFMVNASYMSSPMGEVDPRNLGGGGALDASAWATVLGLFETKFVTLFSLLFGMGLILQTQRAAARGSALTGPYLSRLYYLGLMGLLHGTLIFEGDILLLYSLVGFLLFLCRSWRAQTLALVALLPLGVGITLSGLMEYSGAFSAPEGGLISELFSRLQRTAVKEGPLSLTLLMRTFNNVVLWIMLWITSFNWRVVAMFFLGAAAMKAGLLRAERIRFHRLLCLAGLGLGLPLELGSLTLLVADVSSGPLALLRSLCHDVGSIVLACGYAGGVVWAVQAGCARRLTAWLSSVGRMALTNYLGQSVLMNVLYPWYGLNLSGELSGWTVLLVVTALFGGQIALSVAWMRRFRVGPMEWLWRSLSYGRRQAWR